MRPTDRLAALETLRGVVEREVQSREKATGFFDEAKAWDNIKAAVLDVRDPRFINNDATLTIAECNLKQSKRIDDPIIDVAADFMRNYQCGWTISETIALSVRKNMIERGWKLIPPNG